MSSLALAPSGLENYLVSPRLPAAVYQEMLLNQGALHCDIDGCTVKNEGTHVQSWCDAAEAFGVALSDAMFDQLHDILVLQDNGQFKQVRQYLRGSDPAVIACWILGNQNSDIAKYAFAPGPRHNEIVETVATEIATIRRMHLDGFVRNKDLLEPREGMPEILEDMHDENWIIGAVTGSVSTIFKTNMYALGKVGEKWDYIVAADELTLAQKKPDPFSYHLGLLKTARLMGFVEPTAGTVDMIHRHSLVFEDGNSGVIAAYREKNSEGNGIPVVWIGSEKDGSCLSFDGKPLDGVVLPGKDAPQTREQVKKIGGTFRRPSPRI